MHEYMSQLQTLTHMHACTHAHTNAHIVWPRKLHGAPQYICTYVFTNMYVILVVATLIALNITNSMHALFLMSYFPQHSKSKKR